MNKFLSPSALSIWLRSKDEFYIKYLAKERPPKIKQTKPMSVGSAFDAFVKSHLSSLLGVGDFDREALFDKQVEPHNRVFAWGAGQHCWNSYKDCGAFVRLQRYLAIADDIRMEFTDRATISGVPLLGIPDLVFMIDGLLINFDWKVTGYCSSSASPTRGYTDYGLRGAHKDCMLTYRGDLVLNGENYLEKVNPNWGRQLCTYGWLAGLPVGSEMVVMIHQLVCRDTIQVATHCCEISSEFQQSTMDAYIELWDCISSGHIFKELSRSESDERCLVLDKQGIGFGGDTANDLWFKEIMGR